MAHLEDVSVGELRRALDAIEGKTPAKRLLAAIAYKNGTTQTELARWFGVRRRTIYSWLTRLDEGPLGEAARDAPRSGRPRRLSDDQLAQLYASLRGPPTKAGLDEPSWTPELVRRHVRDEYGVDYSRPSCRRLVDEAERFG